MAESFHLQKAIFVPFEGVPPDEPDRIDREERLVRTIQYLERHQDAVRDNIIYLSSMRKEGILRDSLKPPKKDPLVVAAAREALTAEIGGILANLNAPAEPDKTLDHYDTKPEDFCRREMPEIDDDVEMGDTGESLEQSVQRMLQEASPEEKKSIIDDYDDKTSSREKKNHQSHGHDPIDAFYRKRVMEMERLRNETEAKKKAIRNLKIIEWNSPGHRLERLVEAAVRELDGLSLRSKMQFYREALVRERAKNGGAAIRLDKPLAPAAPPVAPITTPIHIMPTPKPLMAAPPADNPGSYYGNGIASNQYPLIAPSNDYWVQNGGARLLAEKPAPNAPSNDSTAFDRNKSLETNEEEKWLLHLKEDLRLPWKDIAKRFAERFTRSKNEAALQMQYKRLRDRLQGGVIFGNPALVPTNAYPYPTVSNMQPPGVMPTDPQWTNAAMAANAGNTQPPAYNSAQPIVQSSTNIPHPQLPSQPTSNISSAQPFAQSTANITRTPLPSQPISGIPRWTAINQPQAMPLPSHSLPAVRAEQAVVSNSYQYLPPPLSSLAADHPNLGNLEKFHEHSPLSGAKVDLEFTAMITVPFTTKHVLAVREGEKIHIKRFQNGTTFTGINVRGFQANVSDEVLWSDNRRNPAVDSNASVYQAQIGSVFYLPPPVPPEHTNFSAFKFLTENPARPGEALDFSFYAMKTVPPTGGPRILAMRHGELITMVRFLNDHEFVAKNQKGYTALITDEVIWGDFYGKVPTNSPLEKSSQLLVHSDTPVPTGPKKPSLDFQTLNVDTGPSMTVSEPEASRKSITALRIETMAPTVSENTYELPRAISANHPNIGIFEFLKHQPALRSGAKIGKDCVAMKTMMLRKEHSLSNIREGDVIYIVEYSEGRRFSFTKGNVKGFVDDDVLWGEPGSGIVTRNENEILGTDVGAAVVERETRDDSLHTRKISNTPEDLAVYAQNVELLVNRSWAPDQEIGLDVVAVQHEHPFLSRIGVEKGDLIRILKCIAHPMYMGRNTRTEEEGEVYVGIFEPVKRIDKELEQGRSESPMILTPQGKGTATLAAMMEAMTQTIQSGHDPMPSPQSATGKTGRRWESLIKSGTGKVDGTPNMIGVGFNQTSSLSPSLGSPSIDRDRPIEASAAKIDSPIKIQTSFKPASNDIVSSHITCPQPYLTPSPHQNLRNIDLILNTPWKPQQFVGIDYIAFLTTTTLAGFQMEKGDVIRVLAFESADKWHVKNLRTGIEGNVYRRLIGAEAPTARVDIAADKPLSPATTIQIEIDDAENLRFIERLQNTNWRPEAEVGVKIRAPKSTTQGLNMEKGDLIQVLRFLSTIPHLPRTWLAKNLRTGHHGEITSPLLDEFKDAMKFHFHESRNPDLNVNRRNLDILCSKTWKLNEEIGLDFVARQDAAAGPSKLSIRSGDRIRIRYYVRQNIFWGKNLGTDREGEVWQDTFMDATAISQFRAESPFSEAVAVRTNQKNLDILYSREWHTMDTIGLDFVALDSVPESGSKVGVEKGDEVRILSFLGGSIYLARNRRTGREGELWVGILRKKALAIITDRDAKEAALQESLARVRLLRNDALAIDSKESASTENLTRGNRVGPDAVVAERKKTEPRNPNEENLNKLLAKVWKPYERIEPPLPLTALQTVPSRPGRLAVRRGDRVVLRSCVSDLCFLGANQRTNDCGEVEVEIFVDEERRGVEREERDDKRRVAKRRRNASLERAKEDEWQTRERGIREKRENERREMQKMMDEKKQKEAEEVRRREFEKQEFQKMTEEKKQKEAEEERMAEEVKQKEAEEERMAEEVKRKEAEEVKQKDAEEERRIFPFPRNELEKQELERKELETRESQKKMEEKKQEEAEEEKRRELEEKRKREIEEQNQRDIEERKQKELEEQKKKDIISGKLEEARRKELEEEEAQQLQRRLEREREDSLQRQIERSELETEQPRQEQTHRNSPTYLPIPTGPRQSRAISPLNTNSKQRTIDILTASYSQGEIIDFHATAKKSTESKRGKSLDLPVKEGDRIHIMKFISGSIFLGMNMETGIKGQVSSDVFIGRDSEEKMEDEVMQGMSIKGLAKRNFSEEDSPVIGPSPGSGSRLGNYEIGSGGGGEGRVEWLERERVGSPVKIGGYELGGGEERGRGRARGRGRGRPRGRGRGQDRGRGRGYDEGSPNGGGGRIGHYEVDDSPRKGRGRGRGRQS